MKNPSHRDTLQGVLHDLDTRLARQERHSHHGVGLVAGGTPMFVSSDPNNATRLGRDGGIYTNEIVCKETPPTATDFGGRLTVGDVWLHLGGLTPECVAFNDTFERADGDPGVDWTHITLADDSNDISTLATISGGVLVTPLDTFTDPSIHDWATYRLTDARPLTGGRYIEFELARYDYAWSAYVYTQMNSIDFARQYAYVQINASGVGTYQYDVGHLSADGTVETSVGSGSSPHLSTGSTIAFRYETEDDGSCRLFISGVLVLDVVDPDPVIGQPYSGFSMNWRGTASPATGFGSFGVGCLE